MSGLPENTPLDTAGLTPRDAALAWFVRLHSGNATADDRAAFQSWASADARHRIEYGRLEGVWRDLDAVADPRRASSSRLDFQFSRRHLLAGGAALAGVSALAVAAGSGTWPTALAADYRTATAERRSIRLADGSRAELDAGTAIAVDFTPVQRRLRLIEGRAQFIVAKDAARPFEVVCADGIVRALGTAFIVHRRPATVAISVQESAVSVSLASTGQQARLTAGELLTYSPAGIDGPLKSGDTDGDTAWLRGKLVFQDRPLAEVVADIERYRRGRILLWDENLAALRVSGIFDMARPEAALDAIVRTLPVRATTLTSYLTLLRSA